MATLIIWNNHAYPINNYPGHAALSIDDDWTANGQTVSYVSWWPDNDQKKKAPGKERVSNMLNISQDLAAEGYAPDHILEIPGLNTGKMLSKWREITNNPQKVYRYLRQNCATVVATVLKEGSNAGSLGERNNLIWTPLKALRLGKAMGGQEITWNEFLTHLRMADYISSSDSLVLRNLFKRDAKHGKNATENSCYYSNGRKVHSKPVLVWHGHIVNGGDKAKVGMPYFESGEGCLLTQGQLGVNGENKLVPESPWIKQVRTGGGSYTHIRIGTRRN
jgi:hypothetical protein